MRRWPKGGRGSGNRRERGSRAPVRRSSIGALSSRGTIARCSTRVARAEGKGKRGGNVSALKNRSGGRRDLIKGKAQPANLEEARASGGNWSSWKEGAVPPLVKENSPMEGEGRKALRLESARNASLRSKDSHL